MKIEDRIANIKKILPYCSHWSNDVMIVDKSLGKFFSKFFANDDRFETPPYQHTYIRIQEHYTGYGCKPEGHQEIRISYCYDHDRDGEDWATYYFKEPIEYEYDFLEPKPKIKYNEIPDYIWKIIQDQLYENAKKVQREELDSAEASLIQHKKDFDDFSKLTLKE